jgi:formylglycine-generating enzyme required for sulfatase activity
LWIGVTGVICVKLDGESPTIRRSRFNLPIVLQPSTTEGHAMNHRCRFHTHLFTSGVIALLVTTCFRLHNVEADERSEWLAELQRAATADPAMDAAGAVDGRIDGGFGFHTIQQDGAWWQVDLGQSQSIDRIVIHNRTVEAKRARTLVVRLSEDGLVWNTVYEHDGSVFFGHQDGKPLVVTLNGRAGRFVRLQLRENTWFHLDEVQVYGTTDKHRNLAQNQPANQSSASTWSKKRSIGTGLLADSLLRDVQLGERVILQLLEPCGASAVDLRRKLTQLKSTECRLDDPKWASLFTASRKQGQWVAKLRDQWKWLEVTAWELAVRDLIDSYGSTYPYDGRLLRELGSVASQQAGIDRGLERGDPDALRKAERILALKRDSLLANPLLQFNRLMVVKRPVSTPGLGLPANFHGNEALPRSGYADELVVLSPVHPSGQLTTLYRPEGNFVGDVDLHFGGDRLLFSSLDEHQRWRIFEVNADGTGLRKPSQIEEPDVDNYDACYLPNGEIMFGSTAAYYGVPCVFGASHVANLYSSDDRTGEIKRLTSDQDHNWNPTVMTDGRVMYLRWEYADLAHPNSRILFSMNPDGTRQMAYYGTNSYFPNSFFYPRAIPGTNSRVVGIATGHHGTARSGRLLIIDAAQGRKEATGVVQEIPGRGKPVEAVVRDRLVDGVWPQFLHPFPLADLNDRRSGGKYFLVSARLSAATPWGVYLVDVFDNMTLIKQMDEYALFEPIPMQTRPTGPVIDSARDENATDATVYLVDVYRGGGLDGIPRGEVKQLRVISYYFSSRGMGGLLGSIGMDGPWDIKQVLGTVPVKEDGSALFKIPANTPVAVQPLDAEGKALQQMRSWFVGMPGEVVSCVGCHERPNDATVNHSTLALQEVPAKIKPWYGPRRGFSFAREVQPVLDHYCTPCHDGSQTPPDLRGTQQITDWSSEIAGRVNPAYGGKFSVSYAQLHRFVRRPGIESDLNMLSPMDFHADTTELIQILRRGHHDVDLDSEAWDRLITWIDLNAPYHGTWSEIVDAQLAQPNVQRRRELERAYGQVNVDWEQIQPVATLAEPNAPLRGITAQRREQDQGNNLPEPGRLNSSEQKPLTTRTADLGDGVKMEFVLVPAGRLVMKEDKSSNAGQESATVVVRQPLWMSTTEVTNKQYACFDPGHDSRLESRHGYQFGRLGYPLNQDQQPVVRVSWNEAVAYSEWLGEKLGVSCSLPTEAQWEYACRAGVTTPFFFGDFGSDFSEWANLGDRNLQQYAACTAHNNYSSTRIIPNPNQYDDWVPKDERFDDGAFVAAHVGSYRANPWGLKDMHGNVWEWTRSAEKSAPYLEDDGRNSLTGHARRIVRGGSWYDRPERAVSSYRLSYRPYQRVFNVGFRVVIEADMQAH